MSRAVRKYQKERAEWQAERDRYAAFLKLARTYEGEGAAGLMLAAGEAVFIKVNSAALIEDRRGPGHYAGRSQGISIPVGKVGGRSVRYRVGANKGHFEQGALAPTIIDRGTAYVTNKRVIFQGEKQTRECAFAKTIGFEHDDDVGSTTISVSNRQKPTTIMYGHELAAEFHFRMDLALAHFRGDVDDLVGQMEGELSRVELERPHDPTQPASALPAASPAAPSTPEPVTAEPVTLEPVAQAPVTTEPPTPSPVVVTTTPAVSDAATPAGWYADPWGVAPLRWWDGTAWTGNIHAASE